MKLAQLRSLLPVLGALVTAASCSAQGRPQWQLDGVLLPRNVHAQRWDSSLQLYYGEGSGDSEEIGKFHLDNDIGVVLTTTAGDIRATDLVSMRLDLVF